MENYRIEYTEKALEDLKKLDKRIARRILEKLNFFVQQNNPIQFAKKLKDAQYGEYRFRIGDYRIIFDRNRKGVVQILMILSIKHRREVYRDF